MATGLAALILAAGQGKRMRSKLPKVLHPVGGVPMIAHVVSLALARKCNPVVVVISPSGRRIRDILTARFPKAPLVFAVQQKPLGTADAAKAGLAAVKNLKDKKILLLYGDVPLLTPGTVTRLIRAAANASMSVLTASVPDPTGYGRIVRNGRGVECIVEHRDASKQQREIDEINAGVYVFDAGLLQRFLRKVSRGNAQNEYYLTDAVQESAKERGARAVLTDDFEEVMGINDQSQLAQANATFRYRQILAMMASGVSFVDPGSAFIESDVSIGAGSQIGVGVQLLGRTKIGKDCMIEGPCIIRDSSVAAGAVVYGFSHLDSVTLGKASKVGPFARMRNAAELQESAEIGNFVEVKKSVLRKGSKAKHLAYLGDGDIGMGSNVGAGTIFCNYDGKNKYKTQLGKNVFIGSNSTLVAPTKLGDGAYVAAGSTITSDVPANALAFGRARQNTRKGYAKRLRERQAAQKTKKSSKTPIKRR